MTSFSILFSRYKGDLEAQTRGTVMIDSLRPGDHILVAEHCTHHPIADDIGREKIPAWLRHHVNGPLTFTHVQGHDFPTDLSPYSLIVHCGACTANRRQITNRIRACEQAGVAVTNYGLCIAHSLGILDRALEPFPLARDIYRARHRPVTLEN